MKIAISPYELKLQKQFANSSSPTRKGALVRIEYPTAVGYADVFTWPELGDPTVEESLKSLLAGTPNAVAQRSLRFAQIDAEASIHKRSALQGLVLPKSHYLCAEADKKRIEDLAAQGFDTFKLKVGRERPTLFDAAPIAGLKFRLDFNSKLSSEDFENWVAGLSPQWLDHIDFFEDPTVYDAVKWLDWNERLGLRLAIDRAPMVVKISNDLRIDKGPAPFTTVVVKPAIEDERAVRLAAADNMRRLVYTHNLDHPLGRACALWSAAQALFEDPLLVDTCGFAGDEIYEKNSYFEQNNAALAPHWGFKALLEKEDWHELS